MKVNANLTRFQKLIYYLAKLIGLSPFTVVNNKLRPVTLMGKVYSLTLIALASAWLWHRQQAGSENNKTESSADVAIVILLFFFGTSTFSSLYIFAFKSEKLVNTLHRIIVAGDELEELEEGKAKGVNSKFPTAKIIAVNIVVLGTKIHQFANANSVRWTGMWSRFFWIGLVLLFLHHVNVIMIFVCTMTRIGKHFKSLNEKLWDVSRLYSVPYPSDDSQSSPIFVMSSKLKTGDRDFRDVRVSLERIRKLRKLHNELKRLIDYTIYLFKTPIILTIGYLFGTLLVGCYKVYRYEISAHSFSNGTMILHSLIPKSAPEMLIVIFEMMLIAHACSSACNAANVTKIVIHRVWNKFHPEALRGQLFMFSVQLLHNPVTASAFGFFDLGYAYIREIFCAVVAYLVIMIQLDSFSKNTATRG